MAGEMDKDFNPNYYDQDNVIKRNIEREKFFENSKESWLKASQKQCYPISVNGTVYESFVHAAKHEGCSSNTMKRYFKKLTESKRTEMECDVMVKKTFVFKKVVNG